MRDSPSAGGAGKGSWPRLEAAGIAYTLIGGADVATELDAKRAIWQATEFAVEY